MKIGCYVQGAADEAFVHGLAERWCPDAELAEGKFRGSSRESFRREIEKALLDLRRNVSTCLRHLHVRISVVWIRFASSFPWTWGPAPTPPGFS